MDAKHRTAQVFGFLAIPLGSFLLLAAIAGTVGGRVRDIWAGASQLMIAATGVYFVVLGIRLVHYAKGLGRSGPRIKWGRVLLGCWFLYSSTASHFHPSPNALKADNESQAAGMLVAFIIFLLIGTWLLISGISARFARREQQVVDVQSSQTD